jgi:hypothetical protein
MVLSIFLTDMESTSPTDSAVLIPSLFESNPQEPRELPGELLGVPSGVFSLFLLPLAGGR